MSRDVDLCQGVSGATMVISNWERIDQILQRVTSLQWLGETCVILPGRLKATKAEAAGGVFWLCVTGTRTGEAQEVCGIMEGRL